MRDRILNLGEFKDPQATRTELGAQGFAEVGNIIAEVFDLPEQSTTQAEAPGVLLRKYSRLEIVLDSKLVFSEVTVLTDNMRPRLYDIAFGVKPKQHEKMLAGLRDKIDEQPADILVPDGSTHEGVVNELTLLAAKEALGLLGGALLLKHGPSGVKYPGLAFPNVFEYYYDKEARNDSFERFHKGPVGSLLMGVPSEHDVRPANLLAANAARYFIKQCQR